MKYLMAIDAGTGSVRVTIFDTYGKQISIAAIEWFHKEDPRYPGSMDFDTSANWRLIKDCIAESIKRANISSVELLAISCTAMREGFVLYDSDLTEIFACANVDSRAVSEAKELSAIRSTLEQEIYQLSGQVFALGALPRLLWLKNKQPQIYEKVKYITMLNDWIAFKLTGQISSDPSNSCTTGLFNYQSRKWEPEVARMCGLKDDVFPNIYESGQKIGKVSKGAAAETGLNEAVLVIAGGGDAQLGAVGVGGVHDGDCCIFGGSFWQTEVNTSIPKIDPLCQVRLNAHAAPGIWQYEAIAFYPGIVMRWFRDAFCQHEKLIEEKTGISAYQQMDEGAIGIPVGSYNVYPVFSDVMNFINWKHAAPSFINMSLDADKCNKYTLFRALMENAALVTYGNLQTIEGFSGSTIKNATFASGAAKSTLWCQILCDVLGIPVTIPVVKEAASLGAVMFAAVGAGVYENLSEAASVIVKQEKSFEPDFKNHEKYKEMYADWQKIYKAQLQLADTGLTNHMWKAPGL